MEKQDDRSLRMLSAALEMEKKGEKFYEKAVAECRNAPARDVFTKLKNDELVHIERIKSIYQDLKGGKPWSKQWRSMETGADDLQSLFRQIAAKYGPKIQSDPTDLEALEIGIDFELGSIKFYEQHFTKASQQEREFIRLMIQEERGHYLALSDMKFYLTDPDAWFMEKEKGGLDGA